MDLFLPGLWISCAFAILSIAIPYQVKGDDDESSQSNKENLAHLTPAIHVQVTFTITTLKYTQQLAYSRSKKHRVLANDLINRIEDLYIQQGFPVKVEIESFRYGSFDECILYVDDRESQEGTDILLASFDYSAGYLQTRRTRELYVLVVFIIKTSVRTSWKQGLKHVFLRGVVERRHLGSYKVTKQLYSFTYLGGCCSPSLHLGFDYNENEPSLFDDSGNDNVAEITNRLPSSLVRSGKCEHAINISTSGFTIFPKNLTEELQALTIALWIKLNSVNGRHPIVVVSGEDSDLHLEVIDGHVQWLYSENGQPLPKFILVTDKVVNEAKWIHLVAQYDSRSAIAKVYIDGTKMAEAKGEGVLRVQWGRKTIIGRHIVDGKELAIDGVVDEFYVFHCALPPVEIQRLHRQCDLQGSCAAPQGKDELRVTVNLLANFTDDLADLESPKSLSLASMLNGEIELMFMNSPGKQYVKVLQFVPSANGTLAKLSITSVGNSNVSVLEYVIAEALKTGRIGLLRVDSGVKRFLNPTSLCKAKQALCDDNRCLPLSYVCDGNMDCNDETDELDCGFSPICDADELRCKNGKCVKKIVRCDGADDCEDNSDEEGCDTRPPGSVCRMDQFWCATARTGSSPQCIARSFHCDGETDCIAGSDEAGCAIPEFTVTPQRAVAVTGSTVQCTCAVKGVPEPLVTWRLNGERLVRSKTLTVVGTAGGWSNLTIIDIQKSRMGRYTCEAINTVGAVKAKSDCVVVVKNPGEFCESSTFNGDSRSVSECVTCYCMDRSDKCRSARLYRHQLKTQFQNTTILHFLKLSDAVGSNSSADVVFRVDQKIQLVKDNFLGNTWYYWKLPGVFLGNKLVSYGGKLRYTIVYNPGNRSTGNKRDPTATTIVVKSETRSTTREVFEATVRPFTRSVSQPTKAEDTIVLRNRNIEVVALETGEYAQEEEQEEEGKDGGEEEEEEVQQQQQRQGKEGGEGEIEEEELQQQQQQQQQQQGNEGEEGGGGGGGEEEEEEEEGGEGEGEEGEGEGEGEEGEGEGGENEGGSEGVKNVKTVTNAKINKRKEAAMTGSSTTTTTTEAIMTTSIPTLTTPPANYMDRHIRAQDATITRAASKITGRTTTLYQRSFHTWVTQATPFTPGEGISSESTTSIMSSSTSAPETISTPADVKLVGRDLELTFTHQNRPHPGVWQAMEVSLTEEAWHLSKGGKSTRRDLMNVLADVEAIYIRAAYDSAKSFSLLDVSLDIAVSTNSGGPRVFLVEECECPTKYQGLSCELCALGLTWSVDLNDCVKCSCNGHSDDCDPANGSCFNCQHNTEGSFCDTCKPGYYGDAAVGGPEACQPCPCPLTTPPNQFSSTCFQDTDGLVTCNACPLGYTGRICDVCSTNYTGNPSIPGGKCILKGPMYCDVRGSLHPQPDNKTRRCLCKPNVIGYMCESCKPGTYNLESDNPLGCTRCFCNGVIDACNSTELNRTQIISTFEVGKSRGFHLVTAEGDLVKTETVFVNSLTKDLTFQSFIVEGLQERALYWMLPVNYTGNKVTSYGGVLQYTFSFIADSQGRLTEYPDVLIMGNIFSVKHTNAELLESGKERSYQINLTEGAWTDLSDRAVSREQMVMALATIEALMIRVSYSTRMLQITLNQVSMDIAVDSFTNQSRAESVEQCACPVGYDGLSCQECKPGYFRMKIGRFFGTCDRCFCHGHTDRCHPVTGACQGCTHNTNGTNCDKCLPGFYGDASVGYSSDCQPCPCPMTSPPNRFSQTCFQDDDSAPTCDSCSRGHTGRRCERCLPPFSGNPKVIGDYCKLEIECGCDVRGSLNSSCDPHTKQCFCKANVQGKRCNKCKESYFGLQSDEPAGCQPCFCFGVSSQCECAHLYKERIELSFLNGEKSLAISDLDGKVLVTSGLEVQGVPGHYVFSKFEQLPRKTYYWDLGSEFTGDKISSYGGILRYLVSHDAQPGGELTVDTDVVLKGGGITLIYQHGNRLAVGKRTMFGLKMNEDYWRLPGGVSATKKDVMLALSSVDNFKLRATYSTTTHTASLYSVILDSASPQNTGLGKVDVVEECECPLQYAGTSCQRCNRGFTRSQPGVMSSACVRCNCHRHSSECNPTTGRCENCAYHTTGPQCDQCADGFYGNAKDSTPVDCKSCPCPLTITSNQFSPTCTLEDNGSIQCTSCQFGYTGSDCGRCAKGYTGNPRSPGGKCVKVPSELLPKAMVWPRDRTDSDSTTAAFYCLTSGRRPLRVTWARKGGQPLAKDRVEDSRRLLIRNITKQDEGVYQCTVRNSYGVDTAEGRLRVVVTPKDPIVVTVSPRTLHVPVHHTAKFVCTARSETTSSVKWTKGSYGRLPVGANQNNGLLTFPDARRIHTGVYTCTGSNQYSEDMGSIQLRVGAVIGPQVAIAPRFLTVNEGDSVQFRCSATGFPAPVLKWLGGPGGRLPTEARLHNGNGILRIESAVKAQEGEYFCAAENPGGVATMRTILQVRGPGSVPVVSVGPSSLKVLEGEESVFQCNATGEPRPTIRWTRPGAELPESSTFVNGLLRVYPTETGDEGTYSCLATNSFGDAQGRVNLTVEKDTSVEPTATVRPDKQTVDEGSVAVMTCHVTGQPTPEMEWNRVGGVMTEKHVVNGGELRIDNVDEDDAGLYVCIAQNRKGVQQATGMLNVRQHQMPKVEIMPAAILTVTGGETVIFRCIIKAGIPEPSIHWSADKALDVRAHVKDDGVLTISPASGEDQGRYICRATNVVGSMEAVAILTVLGEPKVIVSPSSPYMASVGSQVTLDCAAAGDPAPSVQWIAPITASSRLRPVQIKPGVLKLVIEQVTMKDAGKYTCRATNLVGVAEEMVKLTVTVVNKSPEVTVYPANHTAIGGRGAVFHCNTSGVPTPSVRWGRLGTGLPENAMVTDGILTLISLGPGDGGVYTCTATNSEGSAKGNVKLEVIVSPTVVMTPTQLSINIGRPFRLFCFSSPPLPVTWTKINGNISDDWKRVDGGMQVFKSTAEHAGKYRCRAENLAGSSEAFAVVTVIVAPKIEVSPVSVVATLGSKARFQCNTSGVPLPVIKWSKENGKLPRFHAVSDGLLTMIDLVGLDQGKYTCTATNTAGFAQKDVSLTIEDIPSVIIVGGTSVKTVAIGRSLTLECRGTGIPDPSIKWSRVDRPLPTGVVLEEGILFIPEAQQTSGGQYRCTVSNQVGTVQSQVLVFVQTSPQVTVTPSSLRLKAGESAVFTCIASGVPAPEIYWRKLNGSLAANHNVHHGKLILVNVSDEDSGIYVCRATNVEGTAEGSTQLEIKVAVPRFTQDPVSFLSFETLTEEPLNFTVELFFSPDLANGLVLYNDQRANGSVGDFVSFGMSDGFAEFRFDLGSGPAIIRSKRQLLLYEWHTVVLSREEKLGSLTVDDDEPVTGQSKGRSTGLNLDQNLYVGGYPEYEKIDSLAGFDEGFIGCLSYMAINDEVVNLQNPKERVGVDDCDVCQNRPCKNGGTCTELAHDRGFICTCKPGYTGVTCRGVGERCYPGACNTGRCINTGESGFQCLCPVGFTGKRCDEGTIVDTPQFQGSSFMSFTGIQGALLQLKFSIRFKVQKDDDMLLLYNGQRLYPTRGDFIALAIIRGRVEFRFDLGHGAGVVRSAKPITLGEWHTVVAERYQRFGSLILDSVPTAAKEEAPCCSVGLNLALPLYLGGVHDFSLVDVRKLGVSRGFVGCVSDLSIDDTPIDLVNSYIQLRDIGQCVECLLPCDIGACLNNGTCIPEGKTGYSCSCASGFTGKNCELPLVGAGENNTCLNGGQAFFSNERECACPLGFGGEQCESVVLLGEAVSFVGDGYIQYPGSLMKRRLREPESIILNIKTTAEDGIVLWQGQKSGAAKGDYLSVGVVEGFLVFRFELGAGPLKLMSHRPVNDGKWHKIQVFRTSREGALQIDEDKIINGTASEGARSLNGVGPIFIGGGENVEDLTYGEFTLNFQGCVAGVYFQSRKIKLQEDASRGLNVVPCTILDLET